MFLYSLERRHVELLWHSVTDSEVGLLTYNLGSLRRWREKQLSQPSPASGAGTATKGSPAVRVCMFSERLGTPYLRSPQLRRGEGALCAVWASCCSSLRGATHTCTPRSWFHLPLRLQTAPNPCSLQLTPVKKKKKKKELNQKTVGIPC